MVENPGRRAVLTDAGLAVLAASGMRGLTHRAVDGRAAVPEGTTANYFRTRSALLGALGERIFERLTPDPATVSRLAERSPDTGLSAVFVRDIVRRLTSAPDLTRALFELRLESVRHPELAASMARTLSAGFRADVAFNREAGLPGGEREIALLHFALDGLLFDRLTASIDDGLPTDTLVETLVDRILGGR